MADIKQGVSDNAYHQLQEADTNGDGYVSRDRKSTRLNSSH